MALYIAIIIIIAEVKILIQITFKSLNSFYSVHPVLSFLFFFAH